MRGAEVVIPVGEVTTIRPYVNISARSETNVFSNSSGDRSNENPEDDFVITISPGVGLSYPRQWVTWTADYRFDIERFLKLTEEDTVNQSLVLGMHYRHPSERFSIGLNQGFEDTRDARSDDFASNQRRSRADRKVYDTSADFAFAVNKLLDATITVSNTLDRFDDAAQQDENTIDRSYGLTLAYKKWARTAALFDYSLDTTSYPDDSLRPHSDSTRHTFEVGISRPLTAKTSGSATIGITRYLPEDSALGGGNSTTLSSSIDMTWSVTKTTGVRLAVDREFEQSSAVNASAFVETRTTLSVSQRLGQKLSLTFTAEHSVADYTTGGRNDTKDMVRAEAGYTVNRWLTINAHYEYETNDSTDVGRSFDNTDIGMSFAISATF